MVGYWAAVGSCSAVILIGAVAIGPAFAFASNEPDVDLDSIDNNDDGGVSAEVTAPPVSTDATSAAKSASGAKLHWVAVPVWSLSGDETANYGYCQGLQYVAGTSSDEAAQLRQAGEQAFQALHANLLAHEAPGIAGDVGCPTDPAAVLPAVVVRDAVRGIVEDHLPRPEPEIPPGWALTGMPAYLVTHHELSYGPASHTVDLGLFPVTIEITAEAVTIVDWGDGTVTTHNVAGDPWPDGLVHHTYRDEDVVTVTVTDVWHVEFRVTSPTTISDSLEAELEPRTIDDLEVRQIQAIRVASHP